MNLTPRMLLDDYPIRTSEKLRFADTDRNGHITNSVFAVCCQNARMELLCDPRRVPIPPDTQFVVARLVLEFRAEMHWPGTVEIGTCIEQVGRSSVTLSQGLFVGGQCVAVAESVVVLMDTATRRSAPLPHNAVCALRAISPSDGECSLRATETGHKRQRFCQASRNGGKPCTQCRIASLTASGFTMNCCGT